MARTVEKLSGKKKKEYAAESAAEALASQAVAMSMSPEEGTFTTTTAAFEGESDDEYESDIGSERSSSQPDHRPLTRC